MDFSIKNSLFPLPVSDLSKKNNEKIISNSSDVFSSVRSIGVSSPYFSSVSKARDLGERKYGSEEVIYPPNQEFVILDKQLVKYHDNNYDFYRWEIHMQEK